MKLTEEQQSIFDLIIKGNKSGDNRVIYLKGYAGTGKTVIASKLINHGGFKKILVLTPTATALSVIRRKVISDACENGSCRTFVVYKTFASVMTSVVESIQSKSHGMKFNLTSAEIQGFRQFLKGFQINDDEIIKEILFKTQQMTETKYLVDIERLNQQLFDKSKIDFNFSLETEFKLSKPEDVDLSDYDLVIVDEASMIDEIEMQTLNQTNAKQIVWVGDPGQLPPVNGTQSSEFVLDKKHTLSKILRSNDEIIADATKIRNSGIKSLLSKTQIANGLQQYIDQNIDKLLSYDICLSYTNEVVDILNQSLRKHVTNSNELIIDEPIVVTQNSWNKKGLAFSNSQRLKVKKVLTKKETLEFIERSFMNLNIMNDFNDDRFLMYRKLIDDNKLRLIKVADDSTDDDFQDFIQIEDDGELVLASINVIDNRISSYERQVLDLIVRSVQETYEYLTYIYWKSAYAMTVHKSQGSEWNNIAYFYQLNRFRENKSLDYTAITRAKSNCSIIAYVK